MQLRVDGTEVASDTVSVGDEHVIDLPLTHAGRTIVELEVEPGENELALENNVAVAEIDVVREHLRVLLVSGEPHAGERTWRNVLKSDAAVDLVHFTILQAAGKAGRHADQRAVADRLPDARAVRGEDQRSST